MKTKLGTVKKLTTLDYNSYEGLLKKHLPPLEEAEAPVDYVLIAGDSLPWKDQPNSAEQPLFYVGNTKDWVKWIKSNKALTLKDYSYGTCQLSVDDGKVDVQLLPTKGQLAKPQLLKPLQKVFKRMKPKVFFEVVEAWAATPTDESLISPDLITLAQQLILRHKQFATLRQQIKQSTAKGDEQALLQLNANRKKLLPAIQTLINNWKISIIEAGIDTHIDATLGQGQQLYQYWDQQFHQPQTRSVDSDPALRQKQQAFEATEQRFYDDVLRDIETYQQDFTSSNPPSTIDQHLKAFVQDVNDWKKATQSAGIPFSNNLKAIELELKKTLAVWKSLRPLYNDWWDKKTAVEKAYTPESYAALVEANQKIQALAQNI